MDRTCIRRSTQSRMKAYGSGKAFIAVAMLIALASVPVQATPTFSCGTDTCFPASGQYCEDGRCYSCDRYVDTFRNSQTIVHLPPGCAYLLYYGPQLSTLREENKSLQEMLQTSNETAADLEDRLVKITAENQRLKEQVAHSWNWTLGMAVFCAVVALIIIITVLLLKGKLGARCTQKQTNERQALPDRLLQVRPTEEGNVGPSEMGV